jgi:hypothetical protein
MIKITTNHGFLNIIKAETNILEQRIITSLGTKKRDCIKTSLLPMGDKNDKIRQSLK